MKLPGAHWFIVTLWLGVWVTGKVSHRRTEQTVTLSAADDPRAIRLEDLRPDDDDAPVFPVEQQIRQAAWDRMLPGEQVRLCGKLPGGVPVQGRRTRAERLAAIRRLVERQRADSAGLRLDDTAQAINAALSPNAIPDRGYTPLCRAAGLVTTPRQYSPENPFRD